jgi:hypothetical protein
MALRLRAMEMFLMGDISWTMRIVVHLDSSYDILLVEMLRNPV